MTAHLLMTDGVATANGGPGTRSTPRRPVLRARDNAHRPRQPARIRFLGGARERNTVVRSRATGKKARRAGAGAAEEGGDGLLRL